MGLETSSSRHFIRLCTVAFPLFLHCNGWSFLLLFHPSNCSEKNWTFFSCMKHYHFYFLSSSVVHKKRLIILFFQKNRKEFWGFFPWIISGFIDLFQMWTFMINILLLLLCIYYQYYNLKEYRAFLLRCFSPTFCRGVPGEQCKEPHSTCHTCLPNTIGKINAQLGLMNLRQILLGYVKNCIFSPRLTSNLCTVRVSFHTSHISSDFLQKIFSLPFFVLEHLFVPLDSASGSER